MNRLETGICISMICESFFPLDSHSFIEENFEKKPLNIPR